MNARKSLRAKRDAAAATQTVDGAVKALPAGSPDVRELKIEPLPPAAEQGRDAAREAFLRDAGPELAPPPAPASSGATPPETKAASPEAVTPEQLAAIGVELLDAAVQLVGPLVIEGSTKKTWAYDSNEKELLTKTGLPVLQKHLANSISIEWLFVISLATVTLPKAQAAVAELERRNAERKAASVPVQPVQKPDEAPKLVASPGKKDLGWS